MQDVADAVGVSRAAVSLVLNNRYIRIGPEKRQAIQQAAERLGFRPHAAALRLKRNKTDTLRLVFPSQSFALSQLFLFDLTRHIAMAAKARNYDILLELVHADYADLLALEPGRVDGTILVRDRDTPEELTLEMEKMRHPHLILGGGYMKRRPRYFLDFDVTGGVQAITKHLIDLGHRRIAFLAGIPSAAKFDGYCLALKQARIKSDNKLVLESGLTETGIGQAIDQLLSLKERPTAVVATNDALAIRTIKVLLRRHLEVPRDISIVGFDDIEPAGLVNPSLTTVRVPLQELAEAAVENLLQRIEGGEAVPCQQMLPTELVLRESSGPPLEKPARTRLGQT
jgi:LacI family transcriptional regulator